MNVICAEPIGVCFGVCDALEVVERIARPETVTIYGQLVHNEVVQAQLQSRGFCFSAEDDHVRLPPTPAVLITAHGMSDRRRQTLLAAGRRLIDTTCPLVRHVHRTAQRLQADGYHVLVIGRRRHVEVREIVEDLGSFDVLSGVADVCTYPHDRLGIVCQTTTSPRLAEEIHLAIRLRNLRAEVRFEETICRATRDRQRAVEGLLPKVDAMVVIGGRNSNNTHELVGLCRRQDVPTLHVQSADQLRPRWFHGVTTVGLAAGTSTLKSTIEDVHTVLCRLTAGVVG